MATSLASVDVGPPDDAAPARGSDDERRRDFLVRRLPMLLLGVLFILIALFVTTQAGAYGRTWDEGFQDRYGTEIYNWYRTGGVDTSFLNEKAALFMPQHGPFFETVIATVQHLTHERWYTRSVVGGVAGALGIAALALCGFELAGWWGAFLAALGLALYPRYTGAIFNNSKDVPLAVAMIFVLWMTMRLIRRWDPGVGEGSRRYLADSALLGLFMGVAMSIRVGTLIWYGVLGLLAVGWLVRHGRRARAEKTWLGGLRKVAAAAGLIGGVSYVTMLALWPYVYLHPVSGLLDSIRVMSKYDWTGFVLFEGHRVQATDLPWQYAPKWLVIGSPVATIVLAAVAFGFLAFDLLRRRSVDARVLAAAALLLVPMAAVVVMHSTLLNGIRHLLFVVPGLILLAVVGLVRLWSQLLAWRARLLAVGVAVLLVAAQVEVVVASVRLYPLEYAYFSPIVGGYARAHKGYEGDYWRACETLAVRWLADHYRDYTTLEHPSVGGILYVTAVAELPGTGLTPGTGRRWDFFITSDYSRPASPASYVAIYDVSRDGDVICTVNAQVR